MIVFMTNALIVSKYRIEQLYCWDVKQIRGDILHYVLGERIRKDVTSANTIRQIYSYAVNDVMINGNTDIIIQSTSDSISNVKPLITKKTLHKNK